MAETAKHTKLRNCEIHTPFGKLKLDGEGFVTNLREVKATVEQILTRPNFVNGDVFRKSGTTVNVIDATEPPRRVDVKIDEKTSEPAATPPAADKEEKPEEGTTGPTNQDYYELIKQLVADGASTNSDGYIDMDPFLSALRERGWPVVSGTRRREITDAGREAESSN